MMVRVAVAAAVIVCLGGSGGRADLPEWLQECSRRMREVMPQWLRG